MIKDFICFLCVLNFSVERLFTQLVEGQHSALEPLIITRKGVLSVNREFLFDPKALYALFYIHGYVEHFKSIFYFICV